MVYPLENDFCSISTLQKTNLNRIDHNLIIKIFNKDYDCLLYWFRALPSWSKFHFFLYGKCVELDTGHKYFHDPDNYMDRILLALNKKENGHSATELLAIVLRIQEYDDFIRLFFYKFTQNYKACACDEISTSYNYNLLHYVLPIIIGAYPTKAVEIMKALSDGHPFFEDLFLVAFTIASRRKLMNLDWCYSDNFYYNLQVCQAGIAERTLHVVISEISDSNNIFISFRLLETFMNGANFHRLSSVNLLNLFRKFIVHLKLFVSNVARRRKCKDRLEDVTNFLTFLLVFSKARFIEAEESHKQFYYEIFEHTRRSLPIFFCRSAKNAKEKSPRKACAIYSVKHFLQTLKDRNFSLEDIDSYLQLLLQHQQLHSLEHGLIMEMVRYSHESVHPISSDMLGITLTVYRKLLISNLNSSECISAEIIERIILNIIPKQCYMDPNIFVAMDPGYERAVLEGVKILSYIICSDVYDHKFNVADFLRLCEHILQYGPSKRLVFDISRLHRATLKDQAVRDPRVFVNYVKETISLITGNNLPIARRAMRHYPSITETLRNIFIATIEYEIHSGNDLRTDLQNEMIRYFKKSTEMEDICFVLATEAQKVVFDTKEFPYRNIINVDELIKHILSRLDKVLRWDAITALIDLLQAIMTVLMGEAEPLMYQRHFSLVTHVMSSVPSRTISAMAGFYVLCVLHYADMPLALKGELPKLQTRITTLLSTLLYQCTIRTQIAPYDAMANLSKDINTCLEKCSDKTCRVILNLIENLYMDPMGNGDIIA